MLDAHPDIRCGEETHIIPLLLDFHANQLANPFMKGRLAEAKVTGDVLGDALASYLSHYYLETWGRCTSTVQQGSHGSHPHGNGWRHVSQLTICFPWSEMVGPFAIQ